MMRTIQVPNTSENARPSTTVPSTNAIEPGLRWIDATASATGVVLSATTAAKARGRVMAMKHCGQAANMIQEAAPTWVCAMTTRTTRQTT